MNRPVLHHVTVEVHRALVPACMDFYSEVLGLNRVLSPVQKSAWFEQGIHLYWGDDVQPASPEPSPRHLALVLGDRYTEVVRICRQLGLFITDGTRYWGSDRCFVKDPAGNRIELMERAP